MEYYNIYLILFITNFLFNYAKIYVVYLNNKLLIFEGV